uniref:probable threonine protease PRSS50 isoform X2 n=1 Tax=Halichoerus grypus TaxID=9711 RepID=UPI001659966D|nr:probable threonine protease PRSS50 isoform X2 [Halichoerus grypus]
MKARTQPEGRGLQERGGTGTGCASLRVPRKCLATRSERDRGAKEAQAWWCRQKGGQVGGGAGGRPRGAPPRVATGGRPHSPHCGRRRGQPMGGAVARGAPRRRRCYSGMEPRYRTPARRQGPPGPGAAALPLLLLLLVSPRPAGCLASQAPGTPSAPASVDPGVPCAPSATCPSDEPRLPRQAPTDPSQRTTLQTQTVSVSNGDISFLTCGSSHEQDPTLRDPDAMARRWPWMVSVRANGTHVCAGTLIASRHNFTYSVRVGSPRIDQISPTTSDVPAYQVILNKRYRSHRYWSWVGRAHDIALLKLVGPLKYNKYVWPICLPGLDYEVKDGSLCTVTGWGLPRFDGVWPQFRTIQEKAVTILSSKECDKLYHKVSKVPSLVRVVDSQMVCAEDLDRENFCYEISGEPLVCSVDTTWYLVGLVSWGPGCRKSEAPPIYLQVTSYQHWIWERISGQALPAPSRALLLVLPLPLGLLAAL